MIIDCPSLAGADPTIDSWEVVSDVASVLSFTSVAETYAEVTKSHSPCTAANSNSEHSPRKAPARVYPASLRKEKERENEASDFDAHFIMDGVKGARGGKLSLMFKGNPRTQKTHKTVQKKK